MASIKELLTDNVAKEDVTHEHVKNLLGSYQALRHHYGVQDYECVGTHVGNFCEAGARIILEILGEEPDNDSFGSLHNHIKELSREVQTARDKANTASSSTNSVGATKHAGHRALRSQSHSELR